MKTSVMAGIVLLGFAATAGADSPQGQEEAVAALLTIGGVVEVDETKPGRPVVKVDLHGTKVTDADLALLGPLTELRHLDLRLTEIGDLGVMHLKGLKQLRFLNLFRTKTGDIGLQFVGRRCG